MARRRNAACSDDNLFGFKLGTLKYFMETVTEIAPEAAWTRPELEVKCTEQTPPFITFCSTKQLVVQLPFRHQGKAHSAVLTQLQPPEQDWPAWPVGAWQLPAHLRATRVLSLPEKPSPALATP